MRGHCWSSAEARWTPSEEGRGREALDRLLEKTRYMAAAYGVPCIDGSGFYSDLQLTDMGPRAIQRECDSSDSSNV